MTQTPRDIRIERLKAYWTSVWQKLLPGQRARVKTRVLREGWTFEKAVTNEGLMIPALFHVEGIDYVALMRETLENGMRDNAEIFIAVDPAFVPKELTIVYEKTGDSFIPRPKKKPKA